MKIGKGYGLAILVFGSIWLMFHIISNSPLVLIDGMVMAIGGHIIDNMGDVIKYNGRMK